MNISEQIDELLHDAQHAEYWADFAARLKLGSAEKELRQKCRALIAEAEQLYLANPGATWPHPDDCEWAAPPRETISILVQK